RRRAALRARPSVPTRRSSDLANGQGGGIGVLVLDDADDAAVLPHDSSVPGGIVELHGEQGELVLARGGDQLRQGARARERHVARSEEHTSELQSRENIVCRLL